MSATHDTYLLAVDPDAPDEATIARAAAVIRAGGLVAFPTETVYGLGADALNPRAVARIFAAKERPAADPIIVHVAAAADVERVVRFLPDVANSLMARFWPGPLTLVLPRASSVPAVVTAGADTVAVRYPVHPVAVALIRAAGTPLAAPSANRFSQTSPTNAGHVWNDLAGRVEIILDGGPTPIGVESTVLDLTGPAPTVLRPGGVSLEELREVLPDVVMIGGAAAPGEPLRSPGRMERHYAPRAELRLFTGPDELMRARLAAAVIAARDAGRAPALLLADEDVAALAPLGAPLGVVGSLAAPDEVARNLYRVLRELDWSGINLILARDFPAAGLGLAVRDRLRRAASLVIDCSQ